MSTGIQCTIFMTIGIRDLEALETRWRQEGKAVEVPEEMGRLLIDSLAIERVAGLYPHEETHMAGKLGVAEGILRQQRFTWPIFVDKGSKVILDGMHRWGLLNDFCFRFIPVQNLDYLGDDTVLLNTWCRTIDDTNEESFQNAAQEHGLEALHDVSITDIPKRGSALLMSPLKRLYSFRTRMSPRDEYYALKGIEDALGISEKYNSGRARYMTEKEVMGETSRPDCVLTFPRPLSKKDVIDEARRGKVFPPKATRHVFLFRLYNLSIPLKQLNTNTTSEELTMEVRTLQATKKLIYVGKGIKIDRWYDEHMLKFE